MLDTNEMKNRSETIQSVNKTLFEMIGPQSDGMEEKKLRMLLRLNQGGQNYAEDKEEIRGVFLSSEGNLEEMSTADNNSSGKEGVKKVLDGDMNNSRNLSSTEFKRLNSSDSAFGKENLGCPINKSAFNRVLDPKLLQNNSMEFFFNSHNMRDEFNIMNLHSLPQLRTGNNSGIYAANSLNTRPNSNLNYNFCSFSGSHHNFPHSGQQQHKPLFSSVKNKKEKKSAVSAGNKEVGENTNTGTNNSSTNTAASHQTESYLDLLLNAAEALIEKGVAFTLDEGEFEVPPEDQRMSLCSDMVLSETSSQQNDAIRKCDNKVCGVSGSRKSNIWVKAKSSKGKMIWLCVSCHKAWKNNQYCYYCNIIYRDNTDTGISNYNDTKSWIQCDYCEMWQHMQCEEAKGHYSELSELNKDPCFKYMCPLCRKKHLLNTNTNSNLTVTSNNTSDNGKSKRKYNYKKVCRKGDKFTSGNGDFLGNKTKNDNFEYNLKSGKRKCTNTDAEVKNSHNSVSHAFSSLSVLNCYDNRDIYHDFYKITNISQNNTEDKKR